MNYLRLYKVAMENINEIAEEMIKSFYVVATESEFWYTTDEEIFTNKADALKHQIEYLMEDIEMEE